MTDLIDFHRDKAHAEETRKRYATVVARYGPRPIDDAGLAEYRDVRLAQGKSRPTVRGELCKLLSYARWQGRTVRVKLPSWVERAPTAYNVQEARVLYREAHRTTRTIYGIPARLYYPPLLGLAVDTGARRGELLYLEF